MSNSRRYFLKTLLSGGAIGIANANAFHEQDQEHTHITILHTNDTHSHIDPFDENDPKYPNLGGVKRRASIIEKVRKENPNTLLLDAGDIFQGTPYFNMYGGELELKVMSKMKYDAATMGNHDFDNGIDGFLRVKHYADFPFICSNYDFSETKLASKTINYKVFYKEGIKIGVFGLGVELKGLVDQRLYGKTQYLDPVKKANDYAKLLREDLGCDLVICLSHLGYDYNEDKISDVKLAKLTEGIDLIIGGHTHTFLNQAELYDNRNGGYVLINQVGWAGINLGRIDFYFSKLSKKRIKALEKSSILGIR